MSTSSDFATSRTQIAGHAIADLARRFGTPVYIYDAATVQQQIRSLAAFDHVRYAMKACSNLAILDLVKSEGAVVDTVSAGEIRRALAAGFCADGDPPPIVYTADIFDAESLELCAKQNVHVNCGSPEMIDQFGAVAPGREITLRVNPGFGHGHSQKTNTGGPQAKHGIWHTQIADCLRRATQNDMTVTGLHMHIGSGTDMEHLSQVCGAMEKVAAEVGPSVVSISAGGGLPVAYKPGEEPIDLAAYYQLWDVTRCRLQDQFGHAVRLEIEPGRFLVAECGYLLTEIRAVKQQEGNTFYLVDAGFNNLARPILYGAYHPISIVPSDGDLNRPQHDVIVGGPLCESGDIFTQAAGGYVETRHLPQASVGELLLIERAGAYGSVMSSNYNSKPFAAEVLLRDNKAHLIRARQTFDDLIRGESIPE